MPARFVIDPRADLSALPRSLRIAIRREYFLPPVRGNAPAPRNNADTDAVVGRSWHNAGRADCADLRLMDADPAGDGHQYNCNTVDPDFDIDSSIEFDDDCTGDDPEAHYTACGLSIVAPGHGNIRRWLRGRDII